MTINKKTPSENPFLSDYFLRDLINSAELKDKRKDYLLSKLADFNQEERKNLLVFLKDIYLLDLEKKQAIEEVSQKWIN